MKIKTAKRLQQVGEYYFSRKLKEIAQMREKGVDVINLGIGSPDRAPSGEIIDTLVVESRKPENHAYQSYAGIPELRQAFAGWYQKYFDVELQPEGEILPLMGSKEGIMHLSMAFLNPGEQVLIPNPGYPAYAAVARLLGAEVLPYDLAEKNQWMPDFEQIEKQDLSKVKMMWVNYPHMPTGTPATTALFEQLVAFGLKHHILVVNDNPYSFVLNNHHLSILHVEGAKETAMELNSMSKSHNMAGWRIGMLAGKAEYVQAVLQAKSNMDSGMFRPLQLAAVKALSLDASWYKQLNDTYRKRRALAFELLDVLKCTYAPHQVGMFVWARVPHEMDDGESLSDKVLNRGAVFVTPGFIFGSAGRKYIRISLCATESRLKEAIQRVKNKNF